MKRAVVATFTVLFLFLAADVARGCVCFVLPEKPAPEEARAMLVKDYDKALAVFSGKVIALDTFRVKFRVEKVWKGDFGGEVTMSTGAKDNGDGTFSSSSCDFTFKQGGSYLVYAYGASPGEMQTHKCTRTKLLRDAEQELKDLDEAWPPKQLDERDEVAPARRPGRLELGGARGAAARRGRVLVVRGGRAAPERQVAGAPGH